MQILLLILFLTPLQQSKAIIQTGAAGAEVYLDGTLVDKTDAQGNLTMDGFPSGTFKLAIQKEGFIPYSGTFTIVEGEAKIITIGLRSASTHAEKSPPIKTPNIRRPSLPPKPPIEKTSANKPAMLPQSTEGSSHGTLAPSSSAHRAPIVTEEEEDDFSILLLWILGGIALLLGAGLGVWKVRRSVLSSMKAPEFSEKSAFADPKNRPASQTPEFIDELRRREELIKAGFIGPRKKKLGQDKQKDKEVVIVLPKEAYRFDEDK